ncbi:tetratricopeptide repeat protein [Stenotrophomonas maltophilia]|uniref:tetratricopeptide repeat protein n=1 Tax=Stenotrophomonas maltophilia TaxID=40324 RepID=UPI00240E2C34|nr:tetratricopeptide repeat protein [Stenotrophomonas maltophilia]MDG2509056.1 tetratricopeptide repeat protein [Stenotrophomonas maltophilia]
MTNMPTQLTTDFDTVLDRGDIAAARRLLAPPLARGCAEALFLSYSIPAGKDDAHAEADSLATLKRAAEKGYIPAIYAMGLCLLMGDGVEQDVTRAAAHFERASEAGYPSAMYEFGLALFHGKGVARDVPRAVYLIRASAQGGNEYAREFLLAYSLGVDA